MVARVVPVDPFDLVVFGATGDLARRKLIPALYNRLHDGQIPEGTRIIGAARSALDTAGFRQMADAALTEFVDPAALEPEPRAAFLAMLDYAAVDALSDDGWAALRALLGESTRGRAFYLSVAPRFFEPICHRIRAEGLADQDTRIVVEKPLGHDLASARALNAALCADFDEHQIYRIDH
ncbi:MAG: glucose-6-phosphate dehydrogenase, partial [Pseudomonadota bacterium]